MIVERTTEYEERYWVRPTISNNCGLEINYDIIKGTFPDIGQTILNCIDTRGCITNSSLPQVVTFFAQEQEVARLDYVPNKCCGDTIHQLTIPDVIDRKTLAEIKSKEPCMGRQFIVEAIPYFKSINGTTAYLKFVIFLLAGLLLASSITIAGAANLPAAVIPMSVCIILLAMLMFVILCFWRFKCSYRTVKREKIVELVGIQDNAKYADIYAVWNECSRAGRLPYEIICYREIDQTQLMILISIAIRAKYAMYIN